jgi:ABC-type transporter Mla maintaining outer membrane lipid asymmetry permease subunit MlaE
MWREYLLRNCARFTGGYLILLPVVPLSRETNVYAHKLKKLLIPRDLFVCTMKSSPWAEIRASVVPVPKFI